MFYLLVNKGFISKKLKWCVVYFFENYGKMKRGIIVKKVRIFFKSAISIVLALVILLALESPIMSAIASGIESLAQPEVSISEEEITQALNNAEIVDMSKDSKFILADVRICKNRKRSWNLYGIVWCRNIITYSTMAIH